MYEYLDVTPDYEGAMRVIAYVICAPLLFPIALGIWIAVEQAAEAIIRVFKKFRSHYI